VLAHRGCDRFRSQNLRQIWDHPSSRPSLGRRSTANNSPCTVKKGHAAATNTATATYTAAAAAAAGPTTTTTTTAAGTAYAAAGTAYAAAFAITNTPSPTTAFATT